MTPRDLTPPSSSRVFFEPADTEIGVWVAQDLIDEGCAVLDLGSGSGAAAAAMARAGAARVHGVDSGEHTVAWARRHYAAYDGDRPVTFALGDFTALSPAELLATAPVPLRHPLVVTSNPPYVPLSPRDDALRRSVGGGTDGLKLIPAVIRHGRALGDGLGITIGSYSSPRKAVDLLESAGFTVHAITLCPLPLGEFTRDHPDQMLLLEKRDEAVLWRSGPYPPAYFIVGLACRKSAEDRLTGDGLMELLRTAARSRTTRLETLDEAALPHWPGLVRVVDLPQPAVRRHW
ncbi:methyltransferase domain-containing protein [Streptomyces sp. BG9H]|uniref:Methyltransferase domain-containing protein n=1 Tax=Streptomyces anatolicus TaxID=2675858 RepID=A0ABS6YNZ4_9ACTN|nr:methyltransferase domain-containing protein [Streptomyces anatolicus]